MFKILQAHALLLVSFIAMPLLAGAAELPDFTTLVEKNNTAVVNISTTQKISANERPQLPEGLDIPEGTPLDEFFKHYFGEGGPGAPGRAGWGGGGGVFKNCVLGTLVGQVVEHIVGLHSRCAICLYLPSAQVLLGP
jgi:serine protease Do